MTTPRAPGCREVVDHLYDFLDGELSPEAEAAIRAHLAACVHCFALHRFEDLYRRFLEARAGAANAPAPLRRRLLERLLTERDPDAA